MPQPKLSIMDKMITADTLLTSMSSKITGMNNDPIYIAVDNRPTLKIQYANNCPIERKPS